MVLGGVGLRASAGHRSSLDLENSTMAFGQRIGWSRGTGQRGAEIRGMYEGELTGDAVGDGRV